MIKNKYSRLIDALCIYALIGVSVTSCSEQEVTDTSTLLSDTEITFSLSEWTPIATSRASLFEKKTNDILNKKKGGGNFTLYAYVADDNKVYMNGLRGWYFADTGKWMILDDNGLPRTYFWPNSKKLNFFAYMPDSKYNGKDGYVSKETHVDVLPERYSDENGMQLECHLPDKTGVDSNGNEIEETQEFIYAYESGKSREDGTNVTLNFRHPFALINFKLKGGSYRMTVKDFKFDKIYLNGTFSTVPVTQGKWTHTGDPQVYTAEINKRIPNDVNYNSYLLGDDYWFIVMPQDLGGVTLTLDAVRTDDSAPIEGKFEFKPDDRWEAGHKYTYTISYGNNKEEIYFNVDVEDWTTGYEHNIDVE